MESGPCSLMSIRRSCTGRCRCRARRLAWYWQCVRACVLRRWAHGCCCCCCCCCSSSSRTHVGGTEMGEVVSPRLVPGCATARALAPACRPGREPSLFPCHVLCISGALWRRTPNGLEKGGGCKGAEA